MVLAATPRTLPFYLRSAGSTAEAAHQGHRLVRVPIERTLDTKRVVKCILESCDLSTEYVDKMKSSPKEPPKHRQSMDYHQESPPPGVFDEEQIYRDIKRSQEERSLSAWLRGNLDLAQERQTALVGLREEIQKLRQKLMERLRLQDLRYECGWNIEHFRGCMKSLEYIADMHSQDMRFLEQRILVFAPFTGISLDGHVMLFTGDVKHNWIDVSKWVGGGVFNGDNWIICCVVGRNEVSLQCGGRLWLIISAVQSRELF